MANLARTAGFSALATGLCIGGGLSLPFWYALFTRAVSSAENQAEPSPLLEVLVNFWQPGVILASLLWGLVLSRITGCKPAWRMAIASGIGIGIGQVSVTTDPFLRFANQITPEASLHIRFAFELVLGFGFAAGITGFALGMSLLNWRIALTLAVASSLSAVVTALLVDLAMEGMGVRIGSGNAAMAKIVGLAFPITTSAVGAVIGWILGYFCRKN
jgi:hypothetical protein